MHVTTVYGISCELRVISARSGRGGRAESCAPDKQMAVGGRPAPEVETPHESGQEWIFKDDMALALCKVVNAWSRVVLHQPKIQHISPNDLSTRIS